MACSPWDGVKTPSYDTRYTAANAQMEMQQAITALGNNGSPASTTPMTASRPARSQR
jgi:hypothetical protein